MCGIAGCLNLSDKCAERELVQRMIDVLQHRGPDDHGVYAGGPIALGMTRLAVIDLSAAGHQPMPNEDNTVWMVCNGEIYNHRELRRQLESKGHRFRSNTDSESVLHAYEEYGEHCLQHLLGMYAFAIWETAHRKLLVAVDRLGVKPLYYASLGDDFLFASELKGILQHPGMRRKIDFAALDEYLRYGYVPAPRTIFEGVQRLLPGHCLTVQDGRVKTRRYWNLRFHPDHSRTERDWVCDTRQLLRQCVQSEMESDVPLGALLSGGIDSGSIVAFMSETGSRPVHTFTIGFNTQTQDYGHYDETAHARGLAKRFGCEHRELVVKPDVLDVLPRILWHFDEPFANITAVLTWYLCKMVRQDVTVALAGAGGDENFGGYPRYLAARFLAPYFLLPAALRRGPLARLAGAIPQRADAYSVSNRAQRFLLGAGDGPEAAYRNWVSFWPPQFATELYTPHVRAEIARHDVPTVLDLLLADTSDADFLNRVFYADLKSYLPDNLLTYSDRMSSAHGLEIRVPFCDHRLVEFAATVPAELKLRGIGLKYLLKKALHGLLPGEALHRRKQGFSAPLAYWLRHQLRFLVEACLSTERVERRGYFTLNATQTLMAEHFSGKADHSTRLWALMVFELWHTLYLDLGIAREPSFSLHEWGGEA